MTLAIDRTQSAYRPGSPRERVASTLLSIAIIVAALLVALWSAGVVVPTVSDRAPVTFDVTNRGHDEAAGARREENKPRTVERQRQAERPVAAQLAPVQPTPQPKPKTDDFAFLHMSRQDLAAADIGGMRSPGGSAAAGGAGSSDSGAEKYGPGQGTGGIMLRRADWYRKPTDAELAGYMPKSGATEGWGEVACQTIDRYHVDNCRILGEAPQGSGFGRAVQNSAWQFLVIPPRVNGQPQVGTWVSIRIVYSTTGIDVQG